MWNMFGGINCRFPSTFSHTVWHQLEALSSQVYEDSETLPLLKYCFALLQPLYISRVGKAKYRMDAHDGEEAWAGMTHVQPWQTALARGRFSSLNGVSDFVSNGAVSLRSAEVRLSNLALQMLLHDMISRMCIQEQKVCARNQKTLYVGSTYSHLHTHKIGYWLF